MVFLCTCGVSLSMSKTLDSSSDLIVMFNNIYVSWPNNYTMFMLIRVALGCRLGELICITAKICLERYMIWYISRCWPICSTEALVATSSSFSLVACLSCMKSHPSTLLTNSSSDIIEPQARASGTISRLSPSTILQYTYVTLIYMW